LTIRTHELTSPRPRPWCLIPARARAAAPPASYAHGGSGREPAR
jgi:hypothetical protein